MDDVSLKQKALSGVLCCPKCRGGLKSLNVELLECDSCLHRYRVEDGIFILMPPEGLNEQRQEREMREGIAAGHTYIDPSKILDVVSRHHCIALMSKRADDFRARFKEQDWILDLGCGTSYYWRQTKGASLILIDFTLGNLKAAKALLGSSAGAIFVQADAVNLPLKPGSLSGIWSVQTTQHFPDSVMRAFLGNIRMVLKDRFTVEIYNLNPALFYAMIYRLRGKRLHVRGNTQKFILNRLNAPELIAMWGGVLNGSRIEIGYSELFFHPELHFIPQSGYQVAMERLLGKFTFFSKLFARQIHIGIEKC